MNYYRRYIGDYQRDTMHLSLIEHGAYTMLLDSYYAQGGSLPKTHPVIFRLCRAITDEEKQAVTRVLSEFFPMVGGEYRNDRAARELEAATPRIESAKRNGAKGGRPRLKTQPVIGMETHKEPDQKAIPTSNHQPPTTSLQPPASNPHQRVNNTSPPASPAARGKLPKKAIALPDWWPMEAWTRYVDHRKAKRAKLTVDAVEMIVRALTRSRVAGIDPGAALDLSVQNGWTGVFPEKLPGGIRAMASVGLNERNKAAAAEAVRRAKEEAK